MISYQISHRLWHAKHSLRLQPDQTSQLGLYRGILEALAHVDGNSGIKAPSLFDEGRPFALVVSSAPSATLNGYIALPCCHYSRLYSHFSQPAQRPQQ